MTTTDSSAINWVGKLQEHYQLYQLPLPMYSQAKLINDATQLPLMFQVTVSAIDQSFTLVQCIGKASTKNKAKQEAARGACIRLLDDNSTEMVDTESIKATPVSKSLAETSPILTHSSENKQNQPVQQQAQQQMPAYAVFIDYDNVDVPATLMQKYSQIDFHLFRARNGTKVLTAYEKLSNCTIELPKYIGADAVDHYITWRISELFHGQGNTRTKFVVVTGDSFGQFPAAFSNGLLACNLGELQQILRDEFKI